MDTCTWSHGSICICHCEHGRVRSGGYKRAFRQYVLFCRRANLAGSGDRLLGNTRTRLILQAMTEILCGDRSGASSSVAANLLSTSALVAVFLGGGITCPFAACDPDQTCVPCDSLCTMCSVTPRRYHVFRNSPAGGRARHYELEHLPHLGRELRVATTRALCTPAGHSLDVSHVSSSDASHGASSVGATAVSSASATGANWCRAGQGRLEAEPPCCPGAKRFPAECVSSGASGGRVVGGDPAATAAAAAVATALAGSASAPASRPLCGCIRPARTTVRPVDWSVGSSGGASGSGVVTP